MVPVRGGGHRSLGRRRSFADGPHGILVGDLIRPVPIPPRIGRGLTGSSRLHKEICDFYAYVRPRPYEQELRDDLVRRVRAAVVSQHPDCDVQCFGSFPAGTYLPTADMDLVILSQGFLATGHPKPAFGRRGKYLYALAHLLRTSHVCEPDSIEVIAKAKVPIVKFVDRVTGIRVDLSLENNSGVIAVETCLTWRQQYPAMPILAMLIKQFLTMRGLHEVRTGGLGGFSITCLVTSLLQHMPQVQSGNMRAEQHLGETLMEFLDLYGNRLNIDRVGIQFDPPAYFDKVRPPFFPFIHLVPAGVIPACPRLTGRGRGVWLVEVGREPSLSGQDRPALDRRSQSARQ